MARATTQPALRSGLRSNYGLNARLTTMDACRVQVAGISFSPDSSAFFFAIADPQFGGVLQFERAHDGDGDGALDDDDWMY